ncbi:MAG: hypothetical protein PHH47_11785 [Gallionella sp.]|nr:hypothetical protein [Gallionella sp.]MDD4946411.1 hypothetical protein [Gallionella sp.]MDD5611693.1 hypothetical protein [Gallionella sp.]
MNNPEFKRNLWLSFSSHGLIAMPALLALSLIATALASEGNNKMESLHSVATALFIFVVWLWGMRNANASIVDEIRDKTWDQQRMSALSPWTMTWGKLFGATAFNWYGGLMCLAVIAGAGLAAGLPDVPATLITLCAAGITLHAGVIAINLHACQFESQFVQRGGMGWLGIIFALILWSGFASYETQPFRWWGREFGHALFLLDSALLFAACAIFAAWRVVSNALQVRTLPWAWPAFAVLMSVYLAGFAYQGNLLTLWETGLMVTLVMSYAALFTETNSLLRWNKLRLLQARQQWRGWLEHLPMWPGTVALCLLFALLLAAASGGMPETITALTPLQGPQALTLALMLVRDAGILLFFSFAQRARRAVGITLLYLLVLDMLLPFLANVAGIEALRYFLQPLDFAVISWNSPLIMSLHALIAVGLVAWRLKQSTQATDKP